MQNLQNFQIAYPVSQINVWYGRKSTRKVSQGGAFAVTTKGNHRQANFRAAAFLLVKKNGHGGQQEALFREF